MCPRHGGAQKGKGISDQRVRAGVASSHLTQIVEGGLRNADQRFRGQKRLVTGKQDVVAGGEATEHIILNHVIRLVFKEKIAFVLIHVHPQRANFLVLQGVDRRLRIDERATAGIDDHHPVFHSLETRHGSANGSFHRSADSAGR
ncbi:Uncharacterised protein [Klebsiella grimontii]|uniref:Uncharacterized protein n=1 Tax=Klebsiella grimontii TaxID=2058152 RepID=A0A7H4P4S5_9ENTR|nr:Uncharacterised protein [Klebsiella grimontii]